MCCHCKAEATGAASDEVGSHLHWVCKRREMKFTKRLSQTSTSFNAVDGRSILWCLHPPSEIVSGPHCSSTSSFWLTPHYDTGT